MSSIDNIYSKLPHVVYERLKENKNISERDLYIAFLMAIKDGNVKIVSYFLTFGIDLVKVKRFIFGGKTVLIKSMNYPNINIIRLLISRPDSEIEYEDSDGNILTYAIELCEYEICKLLLLTGKFSMDYKNAENQSLLDIAKGTNDKNMINLIEGIPFTSEYNIIGSGLEGYILYPAFNGDTKSISKISKNGNDELKHEYEIYNKLPDNGPYISKNKVELLELDSKSKYIINELCESNCTKHLVLSKFEGLSLYDIVKKYGVNINIDENKGLFTLCEVITFNEWIKLIKALSNFNTYMQFLKSEYEFTHGDLNLNNISYIVDENGEMKMIMYDFGFSFFGVIPYKSYYIDDNKHLRNLNNICLLIGVRNKEISDFLTENDIIDIDSINIIQKLKCQVDQGKPFPFFNATRLDLNLLSYDIEKFKTLIKTL